MLQERSEPAPVLNCPVILRDPKAHSIHWKPTTETLVPDNVSEKIISDFQFKQQLRVIFIEIEETRKYFWQIWTNQNYFNKRKWNIFKQNAYTLLKYPNCSYQNHINTWKISKLCHSYTLRSSAGFWSFVVGTENDLWVLNNNTLAFFNGFDITQRFR